MRTTYIIGAPSRKGLEYGKWITKKKKEKWTKIKNKDVVFILEVPF